jgi:preprotein translocase subunit SecD
MKLIPTIWLMLMVVSPAPSIANSLSSFQISPIAETPSDNAITMRDHKGNVFLVINEKLATEADLKNVSIFEAIPESGSYGLLIVFKENAPHSIHDITKKNVGKRLAIIINDSLVVAPKVLEPIKGDSFQILSDYDKAAAQSVADTLNSIINKNHKTPNNFIQPDRE